LSNFGELGRKNNGTIRDLKKIKENILPKWRFTYPLMHILNFFDKFAYKHSLKALGPLQIFSTKLTVHTVVTAKQLSKILQFLAHSSFFTVHSSQQLF
jgi:hypothetical protein